MSKTISAHLQTLLASGNLTLATCWHFTLADSSEVFLTNHVEDLVEGGDTYLASSGFSRSNVNHTLGLSVDNHDIVGFFDVAAISEDDLIAKKYDGADVSVFMVDYLDPSQGRIWVSIGKLGESRVRDGTYTIEFRCLIQLLQQPIGEFYGPYCRHRLYSATTDPVTGRPGCGVNSATYTETGTIDSVSNARRKFNDAARSEANDYFFGGEITWTSGNNNGLTFVIKKSTATGDFELVEPTPYDIQAGDTYSMTAGCNHLLRDPADPDDGPYTGHCISKFSNGDRFGGEPESLRAALQFGGITG